MPKRTEPDMESATYLARCNGSASSTNLPRRSASGSQPPSASTNTEQGIEMDDLPCSLATSYTAPHVYQGRDIAMSSERGVYETINLDEPSKGTVRPTHLRESRINLGTSSAPTPFHQIPKSIDSTRTRTLPKSVTDAMRSIRKFANTDHPRCDTETADEKLHYRSWSRSVRHAGRYVSVAASNPNTINYLTKLRSDPGDEGGEERQQGSLATSTDLGEAAGVVLEWIAEEETKQKEIQMCKAAETRDLWNGHWNI